MFKREQLRNRMFVSVVIPIHNEQIALKKLLPALDKALKSIDKSVEILLVDDASTDNSARIIREFAKNRPAFKLFQHTSRRGQSGAFKTAFANATGTFLVRMDGDMQDDPSQLPLFVDEFKKGNEIVVGLRSRQSHHAFNVFGSRLFDLISLVLFRSPFFANTASFVGFKRSLLQDVTFKRTWYFKNEHRYLILIALSRGPKKYTEMVVKHNPRLGGVSKYRRYTKYFSAFSELIVLYFRIKRGYYSIKSQRI
jgi:dolichol-phosphate mannosyltransferase